jgi:hypothetical protein
MKFRTILTFAVISSLVHADEVSLFNGENLEGWSGQPGFWSVQDGAITGKTTTTHPAKENTFLIWEGEAADFELRFEYRLFDKDGEAKGSANSGVQYRSKVVKPEYSVVAGYQADFELGQTYSGILYEEKGRGILAQRGQKVVIKEGDSPDRPNIEATGEVGKSDEIQAAIKQGDWNEYIIKARGGHLQHFINGHQTVDVTDETAVGATSGVIAIQLHAGEPMTVQVKNIVLKTDD